MPLPTILFEIFGISVLHERKNYIIGNFGRLNKKMKFCDHQPNEMESSKLIKCLEVNK